MPTLTIRRVDQETYDRFRLAAKMRDMTQGEYLAALVALHDAMRTMPHPPVQYMIDHLDLETVEG